MALIPGLVGPSYMSQSKYAAVERCVNWYLEVVEDPHETKARQVLYPTPCAGYLSGPARQFPGISRGLLELNGRVFFVNDAVFGEFVLPSTAFPSGGWLQWGTVADDGKPVSMIADGVTTAAQQIFISSAGKGYVWSVGGVFTQLALNPNFLGGQGATFLDDFFITIIPGTNGIQVSAINDGTIWDAAAVSYTQGQSDKLQVVIADREYLWLFGSRRSEIWYNSGGQFFPFTIQPGAFIEMGVINQYCVTQADNSIFWVGQDKRGGLSAWRANGLTPIRVSNHAVETLWSRYSVVSDCILYSFLWRGHIFVRFIFPTQGIGWTYDCAASQQLGYPVWHENTFTNAVGTERAPIERTHCYVAPQDNPETGQGIHIIGSGGDEGFPGSLYQFTDETIIAVDPVAALKWSNDGGNTFGEEHLLPVGKVGEYTRRCFKDICGTARDRVIDITVTDYGDCPPNANGTGGFPINRKRISPHQFNENRWTRYDRYEFEFAKGIGAEGIAL